MPCCRETSGPNTSVRTLAVIECIQGVLGSYKNAPSQDPTVGLCLGAYGGPRGLAFSCEQGIPARGGGAGFGEGAGLTC